MKIKKMPWLTYFIFLCLFIRQMSTVCVPTVEQMIYQENVQSRHIPFIIEAVVQACKNEKLYYKWEIISEEHKRVGRLSSDSSAFKIDGYNIPTSIAFTTLLAAKVYVSHNRDFSKRRTGISLFRLKPEPLLLAIVGGSKRTYPVGKDLILDGKTDSRDFSYGPKEDGLEGNKITWTSTPSLPVTPPSSYVWVIPASHFKAGDVYSFQMTVVRTKIEDYETNSTVVQEVVFKDNVPEIYIECIANCFMPNPETLTAFRVKCSGECHPDQYTWYSTPNVLTPSNIEFGTGTEKLLIKANKLEAGRTYVFGVRYKQVDSSKKLTFLRRPSTGTCLVSPNSGVALLTRFYVECTQFSTERGVNMYYLYQGNPATDRNAVLVGYNFNGIFKGVSLNAGHQELTVYVRNTYFLSANYTIGKVEVKTFIGKVKGYFDYTIFIKRLVLGEELEALYEGNNHDKFTQLAAVVLSVVNDLQISDTDKKFIVKNVVRIMDEIEFRTIMMAEQILSIMGKLMDAKVQTDTDVSEMQGRVVMKTARKLLEYVKDPRESYVSSTYIEYYGYKVMDLFSEIVTQNDKITEELETEIAPKEYDSYDSMDSEKIKVRHNFASITNDMMESMECISKSILEKVIIDQAATEIRTKGFTQSVRRVTPAALNISLSKKVRRATNTKSNIMVPEENLSGYKYVDYEYAEFADNPFWWHQESEKHDTKFVSLNMWGEGKNIQNFKKAVDITLNTVSPGPEETQLKGSLKPQDMTVYRLDLTENALLIVKFDASTKMKVLLEECAPTKSQISSQGKLTEEFTHMSKEKKTMFLGIMNDGGSEVSLSGSVNVHVCMTWNVQKKKFERDGLSVSEVKDGNLICKSSHLSLFGGAIGVVPNKIDLPHDFSLYLLSDTNLFMIAVLLLIIAFWFGLMIWAFIRDRHLAMKNVVFALADNIPGDDKGYLIVVVTGWQFDAGTTADVGIQLVGTKGESRRHLIKYEGYNILQRGSEDWFVIHTPEDIGDVTKVRLWHNCRGRKPHWFCSRVIVQELRTGNQYCFIVNKWFSLVWGDSEVSREIPVSEDRVQTSKKTFFPIILSQKCRDSHLWLSVFSNLPQSNFTTKERVTVAIAILTLSMITSGMFYGIPKGDPSDAIFAKGSYYITLKEISIVIESLMISLPIGVVIMLLFKKSAPFPTKNEKKEKAPKKPKKEKAPKKPKKEKAPKKPKKEKAPKKPKKEKASKKPKKEKESKEAL